MRITKTLDTDKLVCPHCGMEQHTHEPDEMTAYVCSTVCEKCGRTIWYGVLVDGVDNSPRLKPEDSRLNDHCLQEQV